MKKVIMRKRELDETDAWRFWKAAEKAVAHTEHPDKTAECLSFFQFEERRYTFAQLMHMDSCSYCQKTDWMFHQTPLTFEFLALVSPAKRIIGQTGHTITEVYFEQPGEQFIHIPDALLRQEKSLTRCGCPFTQKRNFLQLTPHLFASAHLLVFLEVNLQENQFDVILELRKCEAYQVGGAIPNCHVTFQKAYKQIADTETSEYGDCGVYGLSAGTYQVAFDRYPHVSLELKLLSENTTAITR